jgi:hypothetical protein
MTITRYCNNPICNNPICNDLICNNPICNNPICKNLICKNLICNNPICKNLICNNLICNPTCNNPIFLKSWFFKNISIGCPIYYMSHQYCNKSKSQLTSPTPAQLPTVAVSTGHIVYPVILGAKKHFNLNGMSKNSKIRPEQGNIVGRKFIKVCNFLQIHGTMVLFSLIYQ